MSSTNWHKSYKPWYGPCKNHFCKVWFHLVERLSTNWHQYINTW